MPTEWGGVPGVRTFGPILSRRMSWTKLLLKEILKVYFLLSLWLLWNTSAGNNRQHFSCKECDKKCGNHGSLKRHMKVHEAKTPYNVSATDKTEIFGFPETPCPKEVTTCDFQCPQWERVLKNSSGLKNHIHRIHGKGWFIYNLPNHTNLLHIPWWE